MVDLLIPGPEGKIEAKYSHNNKKFLFFFKIDRAIKDAIK